MQPRNQDFVEVVPEVLFVTQLVRVVGEVLRGGDVEAPADGVRVVHVLPVLPRLLSHTQTRCVEP